MEQIDPIGVRPELNGNQAYSSYVSLLTACSIHGNPHQTNEITKLNAYLFGPEEGQVSLLPRILSRFSSIFLDVPWSSIFLRMVATTKR